MWGVNLGVSDPFFAIGRVLIIQAGVLIAVPALMLVFFGWLEARSALFGGLIGFVPNLYFAYRILASRGKPVKQIVRGFYVGESVKIMLTAGLFAIVFQIPNILFLPLFAGFLAVLLVFWFALLLSEPKRE